MKNFLKLTNFEFNRMSKMLFVLMGFVLVVQLLGVVYEVMSYKGQLDSLMTEAQMTQEEALNQVGPLSFYKIMNSMFFLGPIFISVGAILFYIFLIWYRDWFGKNTFIYRLLMLPTERLTIFFSKLATILIATLALVATQYLGLLIEKSLFDAMLEEAFRTEASLGSLIMDYPVTFLILPKSIDGFLIMYGFGLAAVITVFTGIMMERSFRIKGIVLGVIYGILNVVIVVAPGIINYELLPNNYLYESEVFIIICVLTVIMTTLSLLISRKLLNDRIRV